MTQKKSSEKSPDQNALAEWLDANLNSMSGMSNIEIADHFGYERPNMISMMKKGRVKVPLDKLSEISKLTHVKLSFLLPLWVQQHANSEAYEDILRETRKFTSQTEDEVVSMMRAADPSNRLNSMELSSDFKDKFKQLIIDEINKS
jgi:hypothetical protein